jgi:hypothetical protein
MEVGDFVSEIYLKPSSQWRKWKRKLRESKLRPTCWKEREKYGILLSTPSGKHLDPYLHDGILESEEGHQMEE